MIEKKSIINLRSYGCESYTSVLLRDSEATYLSLEDDATFS